MRGIYVHIPYCLRRCTYCDFHAHPARSVPLRYTNGIVREAALRSDESDEACDSLFIGGGTPSLLSSEGITAIIHAARASLRLSLDAEITLEANPETVTPQTARAWAACGINRVSLGAQAYQDELLHMLGRRHTWGDVLVSVSSLREAGIGDISLDLLYGLPLQGCDDWKATLDAAMRTRVDHLSCYALAIEPKTPLAQWIREGKLAVPDIDETADQLEAASHMLSACGFERYEISSYGRGKRCVHNLHYWRMDGWTALGCGAHGLAHRARYIVDEDEVKWHDAIDHARLPNQEVVEEDPADWRVSVMMMGLRLSDGIAASVFSAKTGDDLWARYGQGIEKAWSRGLLWKNSDAIGATDKGMNLQNTLLLTVLGDDL